VGIIAFILDNLREITRYSALRTTALPMARIAFPAIAPGPHWVLDDVVVYTELLDIVLVEGNEDEGSIFGM
jgi:hypothetical protein